MSTTVDILELRMTPNENEAARADMSLLLEQYKLYVQMADRNSDRRVDANKFFISLLTGLIALLSVIAQLHGPAIAQNAVFLTVGVFGVLLCYVWYITIRSYKQLNSGKYHLIGEVESKLPFPFYNEEWKMLGKGKDKKKYVPITHVEQYIPILFALIFAILFIVGAYLLFSSTIVPP
jgi:hypothetical protein